MPLCLRCVSGLLARAAGAWCAAGTPQGCSHRLQRSLRPETGGNMLSVGDTATQNQVSPNNFKEQYICRLLLSKNDCGDSGVMCHLQLTAGLWRREGHPGPTLPGEPGPYFTNPTALSLRLFGQRRQTCTRY